MKGSVILGGYEHSGQQQLNKDLQSGKLPHAVVLESQKEKTLEETVREICEWAVCTADKSPCHSCHACIKAQNGSHPDIYTAKLSGKTEVVSVEEVRFICSDAYIRPNEAKMKVYILPNADKMQIQAQNALLKIIEEPPQHILFIFCCVSAKKLLGTILSRVAVYPLDYTYDNDETLQQSYQMAMNIARHLTDTKGYPLLCALNVSDNRITAKAVIENLIEIIGNAVRYRITGNAYNDVEKQIGDTMELSVLSGMVETLHLALDRLHSNINMNLFNTWLCSALRRKI